MTKNTQSEIENLLPHLQWLDDKQDEMLQFVLRLCEVNSGTFNLTGIRSVAEILVEEYGRLNGQLNRQDIDQLHSISDAGTETDVELGPLLHIVKRPDVRPRFLLCIHMDTVYPQDSPFQECRFQHNGMVNGPGVADAKGGLAVMLYSLLAIEQSTLAPSIGWEVIINPDEELGSPGSARYLHQRAKLADHGLLFEPKFPDGTMVSSRKGVGNFSFVVRGKSVHSGRDFENGRNAIVACCQLLSDLHQLNSPNVTVNVGKIGGGTALNVVPDLAIGRVNVRVQTNDDAEWIKTKFEQAVEKYSSVDGITVQMMGEFTSKPKELTTELMEMQQIIADCGKALGQQIRWKPTGGASDGNKFAGAGLVNVDTFGPIGGEIHSFNEYLDPRSLVPSAKLTALTMLTLAKKADLERG